MLWKEEIDLEIVNFFHSHINSKIRTEGGGNYWFVTRFYGHPETSKRCFSWNFLDRINPSSNVGWCILGNFNEIVTQDEKSGGRPRPNKQMEDFRLALGRNELVDLG